jgi:predicted RND superfamily exporter protein
MRWSYARWAAWIGRHHRAVIAASALLALLSALSLTRLRLDIDLLSMFPRGTPPFDDFKTFVAEFGQLDELLVLIDDAPPATLQRFADGLAAHLAALDTVREVHSRVDTQRMLDGMLGTYLFNYIPAELYGQVAERLTPDGIDAQVAADRAILAAPFDLSAGRAVIDDPLGFRRLAAQHLAEAYAGVTPSLDGGYFSARDGSALLLFVRPTGSPFDTPFSQRLLDQVRAASSAVAHELGPATARVRYTGTYVFALEDAATFKADITRYTILALIGVLAVFYVGYGNLRILPFVTYPLIVTALITFALSLLLFEQLNAISLSFAAILYGLSIDSGIHFYTRLLNERRRHGADTAAAITATLAGLGRANVAASATTAAAFAVIGLSTLSAVHQLGLLTAVGMTLTIVEFFILYPALGFLLGGRPIPALRGAESVHLARWAEQARRRAHALRIALVVAAVVAIAGALRVRLDPGLDQLRPADSPAQRLQDEIASRFGRQEGNGAVLVRGADTEQALVRSERVAELLRDYRDRGLVGSVQSVDPVLPSEQTQRQRLARYDALPRAAAVAHLRSSLQRHGFKPERFAAFLTAFAAPRNAIVRLGDPALEPLDFAIGRHVRERGGAVIVATYVDPAAGVAWPTLARHLHDDLTDVPVAVAARALLEDELGRVLRGELALFLAFAFLGNFLILIAIVRDVRVSLAVLAPVALVVVALFAGMWLAGVPVDPVNLIVPPLIVGIGVDNGVYLATVMRQLGGAGAAMRSIGRAITMTSLTTIAGFGFLAFSAYPPLATMGRLMAIGLSLCLAATIFVLPALLPNPSTIETDASSTPLGKIS